MTAPDATEIARLRALAREGEEIAGRATRGPWRMAGCEKHPDWTRGSCVCMRGADGKDVTAHDESRAFIADARTRLPLLAAAVTKLADTLDAERRQRSCGAEVNEHGERESCREHAAGRFMCDRCAVLAVVGMAESERDAERAKGERLREALTTVVNTQVPPPGPMKHPEDCAECAMWRARKHPIQHACDGWNREHHDRWDEQHDKELRAAIRSVLARELLDMLDGRALTGTTSEGEGR